MIALSLAGVLSACSSTSSELRADPGQTGTFHIDLPFEAAYSNFREMASRCWDKNYLRSYFHVDSTRKSETSATVEIIWEASLRRVVELSADISAAGNGTDITYFLDTHMIFKQSRQALYEWAEEGILECGTHGGLLTPYTGL